MPPSSQRTQTKRPGDLTGVRGQQNVLRRDREKVADREQLQDALEADRQVRRATEVDYSTEARTKAREAARAGVVDEDEVEVRAKTQRIRVNYPIDDMTFGREVISPAEYDDHGNVIKPAELGGLRTFKFEEGRWYTVDTDVADHLMGLGYVYDDGR